VIPLLRRLWGWLDGPLRSPSLAASLAAPFGKPVVLAAVASLLVAADVLAPFGFQSAWPRALPFAVALPLYGFLGAWDRPSLGLVLRPRQGWAWWVRTGLLLGGFVLVVVGIFVGIMLLAGQPLPPPVLQPEREWLGWLLRGCVQAPLYEEGTYRFVLCLPLLALFGRWPALLASGIVFAALHVRYGVPSPDNFAGGFVFAWGFLASGSLVVPILLHAAGNLFVVASQALYAWIATGGITTGS
jgi:membrane protease YdiL (CAAX protease family)